MNRDDEMEDIGWERGFKCANEEWKAKIEKFENKLRDNHFIMTEELLEKLKEEKE